MNDGELSWRHHPLKARPAAGGAVLVFGFACSLWAVRYIDSLPLSLPLVAVFLLSLRSFFLPADFLLDRKSVRVSTPLGSTEKSWSDFRGFRRTGRGRLLLTRLAAPSLLDHLYGIELLFDADNEREVMAFVKSRLEEGKEA